MVISKLKNLGVVFILVIVMFAAFGVQQQSYAQAANPTITASVEVPLTETNMNGQGVTITLAGASFERSTFDIRDGVSVSGITGVTIPWHDPDRESDTEITMELEFDGTDFDAAATLTFTVTAEAIANYEGAALTAQLPVTAFQESMEATVVSPLSEGTLAGSVVTLTLTGRNFTSWRSTIADAITFSGIDGVFTASSAIDRISDTQVTVILGFSGNIDADTTLTMTVGADAIENYGEDFTFQFPVTAVEETLTATTEAPLTEVTLHGAIVTLTLTGRIFVSSTFDFDDALTVSGIEGVSYHWFDLDQVSDTQWTLGLQFSGDFDVDGNVTITVGANAIVGYDKGFTVSLPVTAVEETLTATTEAPLSEGTLAGSVVTLSFTGRNFTSWRSDIADAITFSGIDGVFTASSAINRISDTQVTVILGFSGNIDADTTLTMTVGADAIENYGEDFTFQFPVTAVEETLTATTEAPLTEVTLHGAIVTLTLTGRIFVSSTFDFDDALTVSGIEGVSYHWFDLDQVSNTQWTLGLQFSGDFDVDSNVTITIGADAIIGYDQALTVSLPVTALVESLVMSTESPLSEDTMTGTTVTLTLGGRSFVQSTYDIWEALTFSGVEDVYAYRYSVERESDTGVTFDLIYAGNIDEDTKLTIEVGADAIAGYDLPFSQEFTVTAVEETLTATSDESLTEATLHGHQVILTLTGRDITWWRDEIPNLVTVTGIDGVTVSEEDIVTDDLSQVVVSLIFTGDLDEDASLTLTIKENAIAGYNKPFTTHLTVPAVEESLSISAEFPLSEINLNFTKLTLTLNGRDFIKDAYDLMDTIEVTGIEGVTLYEYGFDLVEDNVLEFELLYDGEDFDVDGVLTFNVPADAIAGYEKPLSAHISVTAIKQSNATVSLAPNPVISAPIGGQISVTLNISGGEDVAGFYALLEYDTSALTFRNANVGTYLPAGAFFANDYIYTERGEWENYLPLAATAIDGVGNGNGTLATFTFNVREVEESDISIIGCYVVDSNGVRLEAEIDGGDTKVVEPLHNVFGDINRDGIVNIQDLILVSQRFFTVGKNRADVNGDGFVDIVDLVLVANAMGGGAAPSVNPQDLQRLTTSEVKGWLAQAQKINRLDPDFMRGIDVLTRILDVLTPKRTVLLPNYPNPFNPETWIPYHLAKDAEVTLHIYAINGTLVRTMELGYQVAGMYQHRSRAAYWDGKNSAGEPAASGVYYYTLSAGDYTATRKMLILK